MPSIYLNDTSLEDRGLTLTEGGPDLAGLRTQRDRQAWPGRTGVVPSPFATVDTRVLRFRTERRLSTVAEREAAVDQYADDLTGLIEVRYADRPDRVVRGVARVFDPEVVGSPLFVNIEPTILVEIECFNAAKWDAEPRSITVSSTPKDVLCGTLPHGGQLRFIGPVSTQQTITYRGITGVPLGLITLTPSLLTGEWGIIDLDTESIYKVDTSNVVTPVTNWATTTSTWFKPSARDGHRAASAWPTIEASLSMIYYYRRNWAN